MNQPFLTAREVWMRLHIAPSTFYKWLASGHLKPVTPLKIGPRTTRYRLADVVEFEAKMSRRSGGEA